MFTVVHILNQFFAGLGGEEKADTPVGVLEGAAGAARGLQAQLGNQAKVVATIFFGDNYFHEHVEEVKDAVAREVRSRRPQVVVAGPAFSSGRYGVACVEICQLLAGTFDTTCVTAMHPENAAVPIYKAYHNPKVFLLPTAETAAGMTEALKAVAPFVSRLGRGEEIGRASQEGYIARGIRRPEKVDRRGSARAIEMILKKLRGEPFITELPMEVWDQVTPAPPISDLSSATIAIVTTSGVVPWGNPDGFKIFRNAQWRKYNITELKAMEPGRWEVVHGGYNTSFINGNPHYGVPLDAVRALEAKKVIRRLYHSFYVVPGSQGIPSVMQRIGQEIATDLSSERVDGVLLVST
ncbi:MAG: glycine/betaine/sarcosine/D-proline family reductase selenoprotein B [Deltaproteobacteria bacterium]|nr:glycine/betaine/sarcosine/D-proline family reductase selenoprotein B [Deltaproteobacteria bacterium]